MSKRRGLGPETLAILKALCPWEKYEESLASEPWEFRKYNITDYRMFLTLNYSAVRAVTMTGANVTVPIHIPFPHRWLKAVGTHLTVAYAASIDSLFFLLCRPLGKNEPLPYGEEYIYRAYDITITRFSLTLPDNFRFPPSNYNLVLNSTNTDVVVPELFIRRCQ